MEPLVFDYDASSVDGCKLISLEILELDATYIIKDVLL